MKRILTRRWYGLLLLAGMIAVAWSPRTVAAESGRLRQADLAAVIQSRTLFDWNIAEEIHPGMRYHQWVWTLPRPIRMHAVRVDLKTPGLFFKVTGRADDADESVIRNRIRVYNEQTAVVAKYYSAQGKYAAVNGVGTMDEVFDRICAIIDKLR